MNKKWIALFAVLFSSAVLIFGPGLDGPFVVDDVAKIRDNPSLRSPQFQIDRFFKSYEQEGTHFRNDPSRPLTYMLYWLAWQARGGQPAPFHWLSLAVHSANALLVALALTAFGVPMAWAALASAIFLALPLNSGTVLYAFGLSDLLFGFFALLMAYLSLNAGILTMCGLLVLALMSKQSAVVIPAMIWLLVPQRRKLIASLFATALAYVGLRYFVYGQIGDLEAVETYSPAVYAWAQGVMYWKYAWLMLWPQGLCIDHAIFPWQYPFSIQALAWLGLALLTVVAVIRRWSIWLWFLLPLLPTGTFLATTDMFVERRAYLSSAAFAALIAIGVSRASPRWQKGLAAGLALWLSFGIYVSNHRAHVFASDEQVYLELTDLYPGDIRGLNNLASAYLRHSNYPRAKEILESVRQRAPQDPNSLGNLAALFQLPSTGFTDLKRSEDLYLEMLKNNPNDLNSLMNMGLLQITLQRYPQASQYLHQALSLSPCQPTAHYGLGIVAALTGHRDEAIVHHREALRCDPTFLSSQLELQKLGSP